MGLFGSKKSSTAGKKSTAKKSTAKKSKTWHECRTCAGHGKVRDKRCEHGSWKPHTAMTTIVTGRGPLRKVQKIPHRCPGPGIDSCPECHGNRGKWV